MKNEKNIFKFFQLIQFYKFFYFSPLAFFVMHILSLLNTKTSAN